MKELFIFTFGCVTPFLVRWYWIMFTDREDRVYSTRDWLGLR